MIESDTTGNKQLEEICQSVDSFDWTDWERDFIQSLSEKQYKQLSVKQKSVITSMYEKLSR